MTELLSATWHWELRVLPVLLAMLLIEIPTAIRRRKKFFYVPIYFSVFPLRELNPDLAHYLGEDFFVGGETDEQKASRIKRRILAVSVMSVALSALIIPAFAGFGSAFFLPEAILSQFLVVFIMYKSIGIGRAVLDFPSHAVGSRRNTTFLVLIYVGYLGVAAHVIAASYGFGRPYVVGGNWLGLLGALSDLIFSRVLIEFLLLALLTAGFANLITDREIREENLKRHRR